MAKPSDFDLSELERELEADLNSELEFDADQTFAGEQRETEEEARTVYEFDEEQEFDREFGSDQEGELPEDAELDELEGPAAEYGERLYELSQREFESPGSMDAALHEVLGEMGRDYFLGRAWRRLKKGAPGLKRLVGTGLQLAKRAGVDIPVLSSLQNMSGLAQSMLQGNLSGIAKHALSAAAKAHPGAAAAMPILKRLGFETDEPEMRRRAWHNFAEVAREAYENLADNLNETAHQPTQAIQLAQQAVQHGLRSAPLAAAQAAAASVAGGSPRRGKVRVVRLAPGEKLLVIRGRPGP